MLYAFDGGSEDYYFTKQGVVLSYTQKEKRKKSDQEKLQRIERKKQDFEREGNKVLLTQDELECLWIGANEEVQLIPEVIAF